MDDHARVASRECARSWREETVKRSVSLAQLQMMSSGQRARRLTQLAKATQAPPNGEGKAIQARISRFEQKYEKSSQQMRAEVEAGTMVETAEICDWLMLLDARDSPG